MLCYLYLFRNIGVRHDFHLTDVHVVQQLHDCIPSQNTRVHPRHLAGFNTTDVSSRTGTAYRPRTHEFTPDIYPGSTRRMSVVGQGQHTVPEHTSSPQTFSRVQTSSPQTFSESFVFCVVLFIILCLFVLFLLSFFDLRHLIIPFVSSIFLKYQ